MGIGEFLFAFGLHLAAFAGSFGQIFDFEQGIQHNEMCGDNPKSEWLVEGSITLTPGDFSFQPKVAIYAVEEVCALDLTSCHRKDQPEPPEGCHCTAPRGNTSSYNIHVGAQATAFALSGGTVQAVVPGHGLFQNIFTAATVGKFPSNTATVNVYPQYTLDNRITGDLVDGHVVKVCPDTRFHLEVCVINGLTHPPADLTVEVGSTTTAASGVSCIRIVHRVTSGQPEAMIFEYKEPEGCTLRVHANLKDDPKACDGYSASTKQIDGICPDTPRTLTTLPDGSQVLTDDESFLDSWTVIQRRVSGAVDFDRPWDDYVNGFGNMSDSFWLGLDKIHHMCNYKNKCELIVTLGYKGEPQFRRQTRNGCYHAGYKRFWLGNPKGRYKLKIGDYIAGFDAGDSFMYRTGSPNTTLNNQPFTTKDKDHDKFQGKNCAIIFGGGWWFNSCGGASLNGQLNYNGSHGYSWATLTRLSEGELHFSEMKIIRRT